MENALSEVNGKLEETLPNYIINKYHFYDINTAIKQIHFPDNFEKFKLAQNKLHKSEKDKRAQAFIENIKESASPITKKIKKIADNVKARMYIDNQLPDVNPAKSDETPRTKEERIKKENTSSNEND